MVRIGQDAIDWGREHARTPPPGLGHNGSWSGMCLQFVRSCFGAPGGTPNAGLAWDRAKVKVRVDSVKDIPAGYPVCYETRKVEDHIAIKEGGLGSTATRSTDTGPNGSAAVVDGDHLAVAWDMQLLGYIKDINGEDIAQKETPVPTPDKPTKPTTSATRGKKVDHALADLREARAADGSRRRKKIDAAIVAVKAIPHVSAS